MSDADPWTAPPKLEDAPRMGPNPAPDSSPGRITGQGRGGPLGEAAPFVSIAHRRRPTRTVAAFTLGIAVGAGSMWVIVVVAQALGRGVAG